MLGLWNHLLLVFILNAFSQLYFLICLTLILWSMVHKIQIANKVFHAFYNVIHNSESTTLLPLESLQCEIWGWKPLLNNRWLKSNCCGHLEEPAESLFSSVWLSTFYLLVIWQSECCGCKRFYFASCSSCFQRKAYLHKAGCPVSVTSHTNVGGLGFYYVRGKSGGIFSVKDFWK